MTDEIACARCGHDRSEHHNDGRANAVNRPCHYLTDKRTHYVRCECRDFKDPS